VRHAAGHAHRPRPELIAGPLGLRPVRDNDVVLVDARDLDPAERGLLDASEVRHIPATPAAVHAARSGLGLLPVYLHVDVDIIVSAFLPGLRVPAGPGPSPTQIEECVNAITTTADVAAACIACSWLPEHINTPVAGEAITWLASALGAQLTWEPGQQAGPRNNQ
jgi:arginase